MSPSDPASPPSDHAPATAAAGSRVRLLGDRQGLTAAGAVALALGAGLVGGLYDVLTGPGLRAVFAACFVLGCGAAALLVRREHLRVAVVMPPLLYVVLALLGGAVERTGAPGSFVSRQALELVNALVVNAPVVISATALALVVAVARGVLGRARHPAGQPVS